MNSYFKFLVGILTVVFLSQTAYAQQNYTQLKEGEYTTETEKPQYIPDARIGGDYRFIYINRRGPKLGAGGSNPYDFLRQEFNLRFKSEVNTNVSLNIEIGNDYFVLGDERDTYYTQNRYQIDSGAKSNDAQIVLKQSYVEYNHNPMAMLRFGKQYIELGDRKGMVFRGNLTGITQQCKVGTWCYSVGGIKLGPNDNDRLYWGSLDYPIYESGVMIDDPWEKKKLRNEHSLNVEIYRVFYQQHDVPLAKFGGRTWSTNDGYLYNENVSPDQVTLDMNETVTPDDKSDDHLVYFDTKMEYFGFNLNWRFSDLKVDLRYLQMFGRRHYHVGTTAIEEKYPDKQTFELDTNKLMGMVANMKIDYQFAEEWQISLEGLWANGNEMIKDTRGAPLWKRGNLGFYEINPGTFGEASIYFSGYEGTGEGHSINNVTYGGLFISYRDKEEFVNFDTRFYGFLRTNQVYNEAETKERLIGYEWDNTLTFIAQKSLYFAFQLNLFIAGGAYSRNDNVVPEAQPKDFTYVGGVLNYEF